MDAGAPGGASGTRNTAGVGIVPVIAMHIGTDMGYGPTQATLYEQDEDEKRRQQGRQRVIDSP